MSESRPEADWEAREPDGVEADALPVLAEVRPIESAQPALPPLPAVQAAAVAASGFVAGAATIALLRHRRAIKAARHRRRGRRRGELIDVASSRSFLVDVHLLHRP